MTQERRLLTFIDGLIGLLLFAVLEQRFLSVSRRNGAGRVARETSSSLVARGEL